MRYPNITRVMKISLVFSLAIIATLSGCSKLIEIDPPSATITTGEVFYSNDLAEAALAGMYTQMANSSGDLFTNGGLSMNAGLSADELVPKGGPEDGHYAYYSNNILKNDGFSYDGVWRPGYRLIYAANSILEGITASKSPNLDDTTRVQVAAEAKFIRAFVYFYLTSLFGDVPLVLTSDFRVTATLPRAPEEKIYEQIIADLKDAAQALPADYGFTGTERIHANKYAAAALLARVYLYKKDWTNAAILADGVIANAQYQLEPNLKNVFLATSKEAILQFKPDPSLLPVGYRTRDAYFFVPTIKITEYPAEYWPLFTDPALFDPNLFLPSIFLANGLADSFEEGDKRRADWIDSVPTPTDAPYFGKMIYYPAKYPEAANAASPPPVLRYYMVLRLAEQYLITAEAKAQSGDIAGAQTALNVIRARSGLSATGASDKDALLAAIAQERRSELFAEWGHRWLDLKRTGKAAEVLGKIPEKQPWKDYQLLYPIPVQEQTADPFLQQNPGYF